MLFPSGLRINLHIDFKLKMLKTHITSYLINEWYNQLYWASMASWKPQTSRSETWKLSEQRGGLSKVVHLPVRPWFSSESMYRALPSPPPDQTGSYRILK